MLVKKLGVDALLAMLCRLLVRKSFQSDNHVYSDLNSSTLEIVSKLSNSAGRLVQLHYDFIHQVDY